MQEYISKLNCCNIRGCGNSKLLCPAVYIARTRELRELVKKILTRDCAIDSYDDRLGVYHQDYSKRWHIIIRLFADVSIKVTNYITLILDRRSLWSEYMTQIFAETYYTDGSKHGDSIVLSLYKKLPETKLWLRLPDHNTDGFQANHAQSGYV